MPIISLIFYIFIFLLGLCIGSFLNCAIYRLETKKTLQGRSFCPKCKKQLLWQDLIPVFSFLFLGGKCRRCKKKISWQYPIVEIVTATLFVLIFWSLGFGWDLGFGIWDFIKLCFMFYFASVLIVIFVYDFKHYEIPDKVLIPAIAISFIYCALFDFGGILNHLLAVLIGSGFFLSIFLISKGKWMGFGDVKLAVLMGLLLGVPNILLALFLAFLFGAIIGVILMVLPFSKTGEKKSLKSEIPFGPFLITGTFFAILWGPKIINWYLNLLT